MYKYDKTMRPTSGALSHYINPKMRKWQSSTMHAKRAHKERADTSQGLDDSLLKITGSSASSRLSGPAASDP